jgi:uncharacterized protein (DUF1501 family)
MSPGPTRRSFLRGSVAAAGVATAVAGVPVARDVLRGTPVADAAPPGRLVVVFLRGGQDHLSTVVPYTEAAYYDARPTIAVPAARVLPLDDRFGLHPAMPELHALYGAGRLAVVVGAGNLAGTRSHFAAQDLWEFGATAVPGDASGWLGRALRATSTVSDSRFRGLTVGSNVTTSLRGYPALGIPQIATFGLGGRTGTNAGLGTVLRREYFGGAPVEQTGTRALDATEQIGALAGAGDADPVRRAFADLAVLLDANLGVEVATVNVGGWDTHQQMGTADAGSMRDLLAGLDAALGSFITDLDARGIDDVTVVTMTEFGRRVAENGDGGTDHGFGCTMLVLGAGVHGGRVFGEWAGLTPEVIGERGDVVPTVDFRAVLGDCVRGVLGIADPGTVFSGYPYAPFGVVG